MTRTHTSTAQQGPSQSIDGRPLPGIGGASLALQLPSLLRDPLDFLVRARAVHGDVYALDFGFIKFIFLNHPRHAQHVLRDRASIYGKGGGLWESLRTLLGNGLVLSDGELWKRQRRMIQPHLHRERLAALAGGMADAIGECIPTLDAAAASGVPINLVPEMDSIVTRVLGRSLFGIEIDRRDSETACREIAYALDHVFLGMFFKALPRWLPVPGQRRYEQAIQTIDRLLYQLIEQRRARGGSSGELLGMLLDMIDDETEQRMTTKELRDEIATLFVAGSETTTASLAWACHFLARHPEQQEALHREVDTVLGERAPALTDIPKLEYTRMVLEEALRLYPPVHWVVRQAFEDDEIDGYPIPKGSNIFVMSHVIHRHPDIWSRPEEFDPGRFKASDAATRPSLSWIPFGTGQRFCIGKDYAMMKGQMILARLAQRFSLRAVPGHKVAPRLRTTVQPGGGVWVKLERRRPA